jgi:hypothetical protein
MVQPSVPPSTTPPGQAVLRYSLSAFSPPSLAFEAVSPNHPFKDYASFPRNVRSRE